MDAVKKMITQDELQKRMERLRPLSGTAIRLLELLSTPDYTVSEVSGLIGCDPGLTAKVLSRVNAACFGLRQPLASLERAVVHLGAQTVAMVAMHCCAAHLFDSPLAGYAAPPRALWTHSLQTAIAARSLAADSGLVAPDLAYTAALTHDLGKNIVSDILQVGIETEGAEELLSQEDFLEVERRILGVDHTQIGLFLAQQWKLPAPMATAMGYHHRPSRVAEDKRHLAFIVHLADILSMNCGKGTGIDAMRYHQDAGWEKYFSLPEQRLDQITAGVLEETEHVTAVYAAV